MNAIFGLGRIHHVASGSGRRRVVEAALDAGFTHFDLAPAYGDGMSEAALGRIVSGRRDRVEITTKYGIPFRAIGEWPAAAYFAVRAAGKVLRTSFGARYGERDFRPGTLVSSLQGSLRRLRTDFVDCLLIHEPISMEQFRSLGPAWEELERQRRAGTIRRFGISGESALMLAAEQEGLIHPDAVWMMPLDERTRSRPAGWFAGREVRVFNIVKDLRRTHPGVARFEPEAVVAHALGSAPGVVPVFSTHREDEIARLGAAVAARASAGGAP